MTTVTRLSGRYTGKLGGKIRHTEFYTGAQTTDDARGNDRKASETALPNSNITKTEQNPTESDIENGKGRGRNRGTK